MVKKKLFIATLGLSAVLFVSGIIYGLTSVEVTNEFETGIVDIDLAEFQKEGDREVPWVDNPLILPGDTVSKIPRIQNNGNDCYVRAKITFRETDEIGEGNLVGIGEKWFKADDGYYYYKEILPHGDAVDIFQAVSIPIDFSQENEGKSFYIDIDADAIQSQNFTPLFDTATPWGDIEILTNEKGDYDVSTFKPADTQTFQIVYQGETSTLVKNADDFFINFPYLMPGDTYRDSVRIANDGDNPIELHFRSVADDSSELLDKIQLRIATVIGDKTEAFYEGSLRAAALSKDSILGIVPENSEGVFAFEIYIPHELNNPFSISSSHVKWIFSTEEIPKPVEPPATGDHANLLVWIGAAGLSLCGVLFVLTLLRNQKKTRRAEK